MVTSHAHADQAPVYPCGCCPERQNYCPEWRRLSKQYAAAFECYSHGGMTWDDMHWFSQELAAHVAAWPGWAGQPSDGAI